MAEAERTGSGAVALPAALGAPEQRSRIPTWLRLIRKKPLGSFGLLVCVSLLVMSIGAPVFATHDPVEINEPDRLQGPSAQHWAGTDQFGRDIYSRVVYGSRISIYIGTAVALLTTIPALVLGLIAAFFRGWVDYALGRLVDTILAIPSLILLIAIMVILGPSLINVIFALSFRRAITESRVLRGATLSVVNQTYVDAARCLGATNLRIMSRYLLPNIMPTIIVLTAIGYAGVILSEASLSFLGYGVPPPAPSWGGMLASDGRAYMFAAPWMLFAPAIALTLVVFGVNMFGDALRDILDPRLRGS
jgi:peptide/nickel transport system permease protein